MQWEAERPLRGRLFGTQPGPWASIVLTPNDQTLSRGGSANALRRSYALLDLAGIKRADDVSGCTLDIHALRTTRTVEASCEWWAPQDSNLRPSDYESETPEAEASGHTRTRVDENLVTTGVTIAPNGAVTN